MQKLDTSCPYFSDRECFCTFTGAAHGPCGDCICPTPRNLHELRELRALYDKWYWGLEQLTRVAPDNIRTHLWHEFYVHNYKHPREEVQKPQQLSFEKAALLILGAGDEA